MYRIVLVNDSIVKLNVKRRIGLSGSVIYDSKNIVNNGNNSNFSPFNGNTVDVSTSLSNAIKSNFIKIIYDNIVVVGLITDFIYVNNNNTSIVYDIDAFTTSIETKKLNGGFLTSLYGLCDRVNMTYPYESVVNQLPEPVSGSDKSLLNRVITKKINDGVNSFLGVTQNGGAPFENGYGFIVTLSLFASGCIRANGGLVTAFGLDNAIPPSPNTVKKVDSFNFDGNVVYSWYGSPLTGLPICFSSPSKLSKFLEGILSNIGCEIELPPSGLGDLTSITKWADIKKSYFTSYGSGSSDKTEPLKQTKLISTEDIFDVKLVPLKMLKASLKNEIKTEFIELGINLSNFNPLKDEKITVLPDGTIVNDFSKSKAMTYPYYYFKILSAEGQEILINTEVKNANDYGYKQDFRLKVVYRFVGGENPKMLIGILDKDDTTSPLSPSSGIEWHIIYTFPSISWSTSINSTENNNRVNINYDRTSLIQSAIVDMRKEKPFEFGRRGGNMDRRDQSSSDSRKTMIGNYVGGFAGYGRSSGSKYPLDTEISTNNISSSHSITSSPTFVKGDTYGDSLLLPPCTVFRCGYTDSDLYALCRYFDSYGQSAQQMLNPLNNSPTLFSGFANVSTFNNRTFYQFHYIDFIGSAPLPIKLEVENLFKQGVYLI